VVVIVHHCCSSSFVIISGLWCTGFSGGRPGTFRKRGRNKTGN
jgi:hypothetical protein